MYLSLPYFDALHRFMPALVRREGLKVVLVDVVDRPKLDAVAGRVHMRAEEARAAPELNRVAVDEHLRVAELLPEVGVISERAGRAVDVELGVGAGVSAVRDREADELVALLVDRLREGTHHLAALGEGHRAEGGAALFTGERERFGEIEPFGGHRREHGLGGRIAELFAFASATLPFA